MKKIYIKIQKTQPSLQTFAYNGGCTSVKGSNLGQLYTIPS